MANRNFKRKQALESEIKEIYAKITIGAVGAPTLVAADSIGVASVSRTSAGLYAITLQDKYVSLKHASAEVVTPTAEDMKSNIVSEFVSTTKVVNVRCTTGAIATDPASGDSILVALQLKNSSAK